MTTEPGELTGTEQAVLLVLMAECRPVRNPELKVLGPDLTAEGRRRLNGRGLIESTRPGNAFVHELTDDGWALARRIIGADVPPRPSGQGRALYTVLRGLNRYLDRHDLTPADVFGAAPGPESADPESAADPQQAVRAAYRRLAPRSGAWVGLVALRAALPRLSRDELDRTLQQLYRIPGVHLIPQENLNVLTDADRGAAVEIGGQPKHLIALDA